MQADVSDRPRPLTAQEAAAVAAAEAHWYRTTFSVLAFITLLRVVWLIGGATDLYPDEAQYWIWSLRPDFGYYSKPPLIAWLIALTTFALGDDSTFAIRASAPLLHLGTALVVFAIARRLYNGRVGCWAAIVYATLPAVSISSGIISTDVPLLFCWAVALYGFVRAREDGAATPWRWWALVGVAAGVGLQAKYAMAYWLLSALAFLLLVPSERRHLGRYLAAALLAVAVYSPNFIWNWFNAFVSYAHTKDNANLGGSLFNPTSFLEFFGSQFGVFGPITFGTLIVVAVMARRLLADRRALMLAMFALPTLLMMLAVSFLSRAHPNWSAPTYVSATILVVAILVRNGRASLVSASIAIHVFAAVAILGARDVSRMVGYELPAKYEPLHRLRGWAAAGRGLAQLRATNPGRLLMFDDREEMAALIYYVRPHPLNAVKWNPLHRIKDHFDLTANIGPQIGADVLFVTQEPDISFVARHFAASRRVGAVTSSMGPGRVRRFEVHALDGFKGY